MSHLANLVKISIKQGICQSRSHAYQMTNREHQTIGHRRLDDGVEISDIIENVDEVEREPAAHEDHHNNDEKIDCLLSS